ncbi:probable inactive receptor kinase At4g23740 isoform X1 [Trifolium pratense]|uniref:probable inactive receptor kinase At4g23740 isoform X1 n=1 Tax=Trifolium pratense TaxID=57577 RepID=UPI001E69679C|nr:probable inactive receptor kinase At4g23740 isoform X1 [Trifolium pratense]
MDKNLFLLFMFSAVLVSVEAEPIEDKQALLDFLNKMNHSPHLNWDENSSVCQTWRGVTCNTDQSRVIAIRLPGAGLSGPIPPNTLTRLSALETVSLRLNGITGFFPDDFSELKNLTSLYLQSNKFSGPLPLDFSVWSNLSVVNLSNNSFNGSIPFSLSNLTHLSSLVLANNSLSGVIPDLNISSLQLLNLENNNLSGVVPKSLIRFPSWAFSGNNLTSNTSTLPPAFPMHPPYTFPPKKTKGLSETALLGIIIGVCALGFAVIAVVMILCCYDFAASGVKESVISKKKEVSMKAESSASRDKNKIVFFEDCNLAFDLEDLLRASAEILGKGTFGTTYKAALEDATTVAVKRLKEVTVGKREFEQQMEVVGKIKHENVDTLRAYYYSKDEKLVVSDYYQQGSVSSILHGKRGEGRTSIDWYSRLRIAIGTARGIAHIHTQQGGKLVHGNIKASNIFINSQGYGCVSDIGLTTLMSSIPSPGNRETGYYAPEVTNARKATHSSDVYSFGVLLLELLTRKTPIYYSSERGQAFHLVRWVKSVVREEWTSEVFDVELLRYSNIEEEMVMMLQIGMACAARRPDQRPKMAEVVRLIEGIHLENRSPSTESRSEASATTIYST